MNYLIWYLYVLIEEGLGVELESVIDNFCRNLIFLFSGGFVYSKSVLVELLGY